MNAPSPIRCRPVFAAKSILARDVHAENASTPTDSMLGRLSKGNDTSKLHAQNALRPIVRSDARLESSTLDRQPLKVLSPMASRHDRFLKMTEVREVQLLNALVPIERRVVTPQRLRVASDVHPENASSSIDSRHTRSSKGKQLREQHA